jgi:Protein of unknown function (DUF1552)
MDRRMFIRTAGATLWLPFLPSALPREARALASTTPRRAVWWFIPNGFMDQLVAPTIVGENYDLRYALEPIAPLQSRISVLSNLYNRAAQDYPFHEEAMGTLLGDNYIDNISSGDLDGGTTVDQHAANAIGGETPFGSLQLGTDETYISAGSASNTDIYYRTLSFSAPSIPLASLGDPKTVFDRMFAGSDPELTQAEIDARRELRKSLLDSVLARTSSLEQRLNHEDKLKLDQFTSGVRDLEVQIDALADLVCPTPEEPGTGLGYQAKVEAMTDLMVVALQCDFTRLITFMAGASTATTVYSFLQGVSQDHHSLSHNWAFDQDAETQLKSVYNYQVARFVDLATKLSQIDTGDGGDMLSSTMCYFVSEFGESNVHAAYPITYLLAGGEAGGVVQGKHRRFAANTPHSNAWISTLDHLGVDPTGWGTTHTGPLDLTS